MNVSIQRLAISAQPRRNPPVPPFAKGGLGGFRDARVVPWGHDGF